MVAGLLLLLHLLFGMHFHSSLDLVIPFLLLNLSLRFGFLKFVMMLSYRMMMFSQDDNVVLQFCRFRILLLFLLCKALLDHWELALYKYCILLLLLLLFIPKKYYSISVTKSTFLFVSSVNTLLAILKVTDARRDVILAGGLYHRFPWRHNPSPPLPLPWSAQNLIVGEFAARIRSTENVPV